ncbi:siphovirus ReqiPepy6 Gp37-like family protein [Streptomyces alfalfae]|uniref:siphovirus ReqiPepy6 Gp37-like family protein n=1 Tax=Streptomyces alfalfae TaxID=1642299 RepID=UPI001BAD4214|nr:siphovirus ReqiPepy6 Gp37-like family protein [Streptomyces alfalfae]QUI30687.1 siphovirus ReqiPepy6 Gp37-like family protein [Streptomyces alfalfae]
MGYRVEVRDRELNRIGEIDTWIKLDFVVRFSQAGTWQLLIKDGTAQAKLLDKGGGIAVYQDGVAKPVFTGRIESFQKYWTTQQHTEEGSLYVGGSCDNDLPYGRLAFPDPSLTIPQQYKGKDTRTVSGAAGAAIWNEFNTSFGPGALADRRVAGIDMGEKPTFGDKVSGSLRYDLIGTTIEDWTESKKVGYRFLWNPNAKKIELDIYQPRDLSKDVRFSKDLGNLREFIYTLSAPRVTRVIVACQGEGAERYIWQKIDSATEAEWGVAIESSVDRRDVPLKTNSSGKPELVTKQGSDGIEDIGQDADGSDWTKELTAARRDYQTAATAVTAAEKQVSEAKTDAAKKAAEAQLASAKAAQATALTKLKAEITAAKPTAVKHYLSVIEEAADSVLKENAKSGNFQIYPIDTPQCRFGVHYFVGDLVTVAVDGTEYSDIVREVNVTVEDGGKVSVTPKIGEQGTGEPLNLYKNVFEMREKLRKLEARL